MIGYDGIKGGEKWLLTVFCSYFSAKLIKNNEKLINFG